ncbi:hypothetical protein GE061_013439 [Apolygus lucorum]|uniref:SCP domain-containing protein n=1 Tax=Apolygus lucorum TaxID=248454 RepID=A0A8S9XRV6_APOLU|nr:hypothetical protein GE061_013439 [Apolygus lucorum]
MYSSRRTQILKLGLWLSFVILKSVEGLEWCKLHCPDGSENTMCKYKPLSGTNNCTEIRESTTPTVRREMLELHNAFRNALAGGNIPGWPKAANMKYLTWDGDLEQLALRWAMQCVSGHDECRRTKTFDYVGQNFGMIGNTAFYPSSNISFQGWIDEIKFATGALVKSFQEGKWVHFSQVGWGNTSKIGCGEIRYLDRQLKKTAIVCNYGFSGNLFSVEMYTVGEPCSQCPVGMMCQNASIWPNLCTIPHYVIPRMMESGNQLKLLPNAVPAPGRAPSRLKQVIHQVPIAVLIIFSLY